MRLAPDGRTAVFVRQWIDPETKRERNSLWMVDGAREKARPLEPGEPDARAPVFSPDGRWIAFLSTRPRPEGWTHDAAGPAGVRARDRPLADPGRWRPERAAGRPPAPYGRVFHDAFYGRVAFSPDGRRLVFVADDGRDPRTPQERAADVEIVRPDQGEGYTGYGPAQVWVAHLDAEPGKSAASRIERLTDDDVWYGDPQWSPDGRTVVVHANKTADRESVRYSINKNFDLWAIDVETRAARQLTSGPGPDVSPRFSPDGKRIACLSIPRKGSHMDVFNLGVVTLGEGGDAVRVVFDHHGPGADRPPHPAPLFPLPEECWAGRRRADLQRGPRDRDGDVPGGPGRRQRGPGRDHDGRRAGVPPGAADRRAAEASSGADARGQPVPARARAGEDPSGPLGERRGRAIEGVLTLPPESVARPPYKMVLLPHGGPHSRSVEGFNFTAQVFAAHGYAVFQPNFRGSAGYGQELIDADRVDFGGGDMRDILTGIDDLIRQGLVDPDRQFVYGVSYGGYMTCWLVGHTNRFRAAVAQNAVTDLDVMWGLSDLQSWTEWEFGGRPWEVAAAMREHSPFTYAANVQTPTLILHSRDDRRCPLPMGQVFHRALLARGVPTQMVIYPGEGHGIRQPRHREDVLRRTLAWFERYDKK